MVFLLSHCCVLFLYSAGPSGEGTRQEALGEGTSPQSVESSSHGDHCALPQPSLRQLVIDLERIPEGNDKVKFHEAFKSLLENHPVTLSGQIPKVRLRRDTSEANQRTLYTHWAKEQLEMRVKHTRGKLHLTSHIQHYFQEKLIA